MADYGERGDERPGDDPDADDVAPSPDAEPTGDQDPPGDPDQPVETVVRYETAAERRERLREERRNRRHRRITETGVALAALLISCAVFLVNGALFFRGSEMAVLEPEEVLFYRDAGPNASALWIGLQAQMINAASADYGDVVTEAFVAIGPARTERGRFRYRHVIEPVMSQNVEKALEDCPEGARCIGNTGMYVIERTRALLDVPGGASRAAYLAFWVEEIACDGEPAFCGSFGGFEDALAHLRSRPDPVIRMKLKFHSDGAEEVTCRLPADPERRKVIFDYLEEKGWAQVPCEKAKRRRASS